MLSGTFAGPCKKSLLPLRNFKSSFRFTKVVLLSKGSRLETLGLTMKLPWILLHANRSPVFQGPVTKGTMFSWCTELTWYKSQHASL